MIFVKQKCQKTVVKIYKRRKTEDRRRKTEDGRPKTEEARRKEIPSWEG
jgi:hypothetical protein